MKNKSGFTLVELIVVIAILGLLTVIAVFNYLNVQRDARDKQRASDATVVSDSLEKYFAKNGEYPSVAKITNSDGTAVKQLLGLTGLDSLIAPFSPSGTTNSWKTGTASKTITLTYSGNTDTSATCNTDTTATASCTDFKIQYYNEQDGTTTTIYSRNKSVAVNVTQREGVVAPDAPTVSAALVGSNATATANPVTCQAGATAQYAFQSRTNNGTWSSWSGWGTTNTNAVPATQGTKYGFQAKSQCVVGSTPSAASAISSEATYVHPISTPAALSVYATASFRPNYNSGICIDANGQGGVGTLVQIYACNGTAAQDWAYNSNDKTIRPTYNTNLCVTAGAKGAQLTLQTCDGATARQWNSDARGYYIAVSTGYCMDASNWGTANGTPIGTWDCNNATAQIWNPSDSQTAWTWPATTCPAGATVEYRVNNQTTSLTDSGWTSTGTTPRVVRTTVNQGYTYTTQAQSRCYTAYTSSSWSNIGQSSINKAVYRPGNPTGWSFGVWSGRDGWGWSFASPTCGAGTTKTYQEESWIGVNNNSGGSLMYWLSPRTPNGPGYVGWYTAESTGGAAYVWYAPDGNDRGMTYVSQPSGGVPYGVDVTARAMYRCRNNTTGREAYGDWYQTSFSNT